MCSQTQQMRRPRLIFQERLDNKMAHIVSAFDEDFADLTDMLARLGGMAEAQFTYVIDAIEHRNLDQLDTIIKGDKELDVIELEINERALRLIALRAPMAQDLRRVLVSLKVAAALERIGDYAKNIAKRSKVFIPGNHYDAPMASVLRMARLAQAMLHQVMNAYIEMDSDLAIDVWEQDVAIDQLHNALFQNLLDLIGSSGDRAAIISHLLFTAKNIERVGDHVTNIAEQIYFVNHGKFPEDDRPKADISSNLSTE